MIRSDSRNVIAEKSMAFAVRIVNLYKHLRKAKAEHVMSKQVLRSGTSIGANVREAESAQSKADFVSKMAIALKECARLLTGLSFLFARSTFRRRSFRQS